VASRARVPGECARDLLDTAARLLRPGGRLVFFMPAAPGAGSAGDAPAHPALALVSSCEQARVARGWPALAAAGALHTCFHVLFSMRGCSDGEVCSLWEDLCLMLVCPGLRTLENSYRSAKPSCAMLCPLPQQQHHVIMPFIAKKMLHVRGRRKVEVKHFRPPLRMHSG